RRADLSRPAADRPRQVSLRDVAREADVSVATVSMVLNENPRISRGTQQRVRQVMKKLGYQPNRLAQSLSGKHTHVLAVLLPALRHAFADAYFGELLSGISDAAHRLGWKVLLEQAKPDYIAAGKHVELFERRYVDGMLLLGTSDSQAYLSDLQDIHCPAIVVNNRLRLPDDPETYVECDHVVCDYAGGAQQALNYLTQLGHRRIGLISAAPDIATAWEIRQTWQAALEKVGAEPTDAWIADGQYTEEGGAAAARKLVRSDIPFTAMLAMNDKMAMGAMSFLNHKGIKVPGQISVVGFDDLRHAAFVNPALTTIRLPLYDVGLTSCKRLIEKIKGKTTPVADVLDTHLIVRESTAMAEAEASPKSQ
ncbi:MAG: LacI family DNA-binding transcriptional regulator, partial [Planctomycetota bacterium]